MGEVWLATAHGAGGFAKKVVLKTILPGLAEDPAYVEMLINEASIVARLNHPNIVQVFDLECIDGMYFIAMEYLPGRTLNQLLQRLDRNKERVPPWLALMVAASCCDGLQYAHDYSDEEGRSLGLLHRDVSPSNIMLTFAGSVTILDFGIAKAMTGEQPTGRGALKGKFHYMPPERIRGLPGDRTSDVYSLGVILYQLLAWRRPFNAANDAALLDRILRERPAPLRKHSPWLSPRIEQTVHKALAKRPGDRYQQAADLAADLRAHLRETGEQREPAELAAFVRDVFGDAPEVKGWVGTARGTGKSGALDPALSGPLLGSDSGTFEIVEMEATPLDEAAVLEEIDVAGRPGHDVFGAPDAVTGDGHIATAFGSSEPTPAPPMPEEPLSVYDLAARPLRPQRDSETSALFTTRPARERGTGDSDLFGVRRIEASPQAPEDASDAPFVGDREPSEPRWPWAPLAKKSREP